MGRATYDEFLGLARQHRGQRRWDALRPTLEATVLAGGESEVTIDALDAASIAASKTIAQRRIQPPWLNGWIARRLEGQGGWKRLTHPEFEWPELNSPPEFEDTLLFRSPAADMVEVTTSVLPIHGDPVVEWAVFAVDLAKVDGPGVFEHLNNI